METNLPDEKPAAPPIKRGPGRPRKVRPVEATRKPGRPTYREVADAIEAALEALWENYEAKPSWPVNLSGWGLYERRSGKHVVRMLEAWKARPENVVGSSPLKGPVGGAPTAS